jgi:hypothetical protein
MFMKQKLYITALFITLLCDQTLAQSNSKSDTYIKLSGGRVVYGTGDVIGSSLAFDISTNILKSSRPGLSQLLLGGELIFENGSRTTKVENPSTNEFFNDWFQHNSDFVLWGKASYYPFRQVLKGFNIQIGPTFGYSYVSSEARASRQVDITGYATRISTLRFDNRFTFGYRISTGLEFNLSPRFLAGFRLDFSNNTAEDINTLAGIKLGYKL